ncbi:FAD-dependent oxidoreductase [Candidatus Berkelbacteria bacterium]|nr:FAD-dependent oxidoreductase [Candidatus Berkelbacteria bacterium]
MTDAPKNIVILGAGFAGVRAALDLAARQDELADHRIVLVDRNTYHLFTPWLYERASTGSPVHGLKIPLASIFHGWPVDLVHGEVQTIDRTRHQIRLTNRVNLTYAYLVVALGSVSNDCGIPGIAAHALPLKTYADAERIRAETEAQYRDFLASAQPTALFQVVIGGAGTTGVELTGEVHRHLKHLAQRLGDGEGRFVVKLVEAEDRLLPGFPDWVSRAAHVRLGQYRRIEILLQSRIASVTAHTVTLTSGDTHQSPVFIWTGGVRTNPRVGADLLGDGGRIPVNRMLQLPNDPDVFAIGDNAGPSGGRSKTECPLTIQNAYAQGSAAAANLIRHIRGQPLVPLVIDHPGFIVPVRGHWAVSTIGRPLVGHLAYWLLRLVHLRYFLWILPFSEAVRRWYRRDEERHA